MLFDGYRPHPHQLRFHRESRRFAALAAGVRGGKTYAAAREFIKRVYLDRLRKNGRLHYWCAAPTYAIGKVQTYELFDVLGGLGGTPVSEYHAGDRELWLKGDILIEFKTTERPEALVAAGLDGLWLDEAARAKEEAWLGGLRHRLIDRRGWAVFSTTPLGHNWFYRYIVQKAWTGEPDFSVHSWRTLDNLLIPGLAQEVAQAARELPEIYFRREYEASFDAFVGQIYGEFDPALHIVDREPDEAVETRYGVDWGFRHPGAILCLQRDALGSWMVVEEVVARQVLIASPGETSWAKWARELTARRGAGTFYCDPSAPAYIRHFRQAGLPARAANNDLAGGIQTVAKALHSIAGRPGLVVHRRCRTVIEELLNYRWDPDADGETPLKENDHTCDALRYALHVTAHRPAFW
ncbi:MAG: hypothetical protein GX444_08275 [Myxococcales bacterium]|nr:hypothetical protein [Myxococcales bacterium]